MAFPKVQSHPNRKLLASAKLRLPKATQKPKHHNQTPLSYNSIKHPNLPPQPPKQNQRFLKCNINLDTTKFITVLPISIHSQTSSILITNNSNSSFMKLPPLSDSRSLLMESKELKVPDILCMEEAMIPLRPLSYISAAGILVYSILILK